MNYLNFTSNNGRQRGGRRERLVLAIDASPSMEDDDWPPTRLLAAIEAAIALIVRKCQIAPEDRVGVVAYSKDAWCVAPLDVVGVSCERLCRQIRKIETDSYTNIHAALSKAGELLSVDDSQTPSSWISRFLVPTQDHERTSDLKRIILLTDGDHNHGESPEAIARQLKNEGVCIDCVGIGGDPSDVNEDLLKTIASTHDDGTTPRYAFIGDKDNLVQKFEQLAGRISR